MVKYRRFVVVDRDTGETLAHPGVARGETAYDALSRNHVPIRTACRGSSICGLCVVLVGDGVEDLPPPMPDELELLHRYGNTEPNARLACRFGLPETRDHLVIALRPAK